MENGMTAKNWAQIIGLTCAAFIFNTSEFMPIGLLTDIAQDFAITEAHAGTLISAYAWVVMLLSLPLMILVSKLELRKLMLWIILLFGICQILSSLSEGYAMLMLSRIGVACTHAIFWSIVSPLAVKLVPHSHRALALSMIVTGTSIAMIFGLPLGRMVGLTIGWRMTFLGVGILAFLTFAYLAFSLPKVPSNGGFSLHKLPELLKNPILTGLYILTFAIATSYYVGYSYIEPFLKQVAHLQDNWITATLMIFGGMGILGSFAFSKFYPKHPYPFLTTILLCVTGCLGLLHLASFAPPTVILLCAVWGMAVTAFNVSLQAEIINKSPLDATSVSMSIFSGIFNLGIAIGTSIGGAVCTYLSISEIGYAGAIIALLAFLYWKKVILHKLKKAQTA